MPAASGEDPHHDDAPPLWHHQCLLALAVWRQLPRGPHCPAKAPEPPVCLAYHPVPRKWSISGQSARQDIVNPLWQYWKHFLPEETEMDEPDEDSWAISEMEYAGIPSMREDRCRGDYGDTPIYHTVPSPTMDDDDGILEGSMVEVLPGTETALLRPEDAGKDQLARQQMTPGKQLNNRGLNDHVPQMMKFIKHGGLNSHIPPILSM